jgi:hypothetical protein
MLKHMTNIYHFRVYIHFPNWFPVILCISLAFMSICYTKTLKAAKLITVKISHYITNFMELSPS